MNIAGLSDLIKQAISGPQTPLFPPNMQQKPQPTIQPNVPTPSFRPTANGGYEALNVQPGTSTFAPWAPGVGVLQNPERGLPRFDPTGEYNDNNLPKNPHSYLLMPMAMPEFQHFDFIQPIGGGHGR
jgi:hypothetical protein